MAAQETSEDDVSETNDGDSNHPILIEREWSALAALTEHPGRLDDLPENFGADAFTTPERRAYFKTLAAWSREGPPPDAPAELARSRGVWTDVWRCHDAAAVRAIRGAAIELEHAASAWLRAPTDEGLSVLHASVNAAIERIAFRWADGTRTADDLYRASAIDGDGWSQAANRHVLPPPSGWETAAGPIPFGSLVFVREARAPGVASASVAWAVAAARQGLPTALWARRLTEQCVADHLLALEAGVGLRAMREGALTEVEWSAVSVAQEGVTALPLLVAGGKYHIKVGDLLRNLRRWRCEAARVRVVVVDGAEHLDVEPRALFRVARMMEVVNCGYLVVVGNEGHAAEEFADLVLDERQWVMSGANMNAGGTQ